jgi:hypothetical protein
MGKAVATTPSKKRWVRVKWIAPLTAAVLLVIAHQTGLLGFGWARLMSSMFPGDESLLAYVPNDVSSFAVIDPHRIDLKALGSEQGAARSALESRVRDVKKVTDIDLASDVDKLVVSPALVVGRGRFHGDKLSERLVEYRYTRAKHRGVGYLIREGADAIAIIDDSIVLYGSEEWVKRAIDAKESGTSVKDDAKVTARLDAIGWDHPLIATVRLVDDKPSLRDMLAGSSGPRAVTFEVETKGGFTVHAAVEASTPSAAEDLKKLLDERRASPEIVVGLLGAGAGEYVAEIAKGTTVAVEPGTSTVHIRAPIPLAALDAAALALGKSEGSLTDTWKSFKLLQLLGSLPQGAGASGSSSASAPPAATTAAPAASSGSAAAPEGPAATAAPAGSPQGSGSAGTPQAPATTATPP